MNKRLGFRGAFSLGQRGGAGISLGSLALRDPLALKRVIAHVENILEISRSPDVLSDPSLLASWPTKKYI